MVPEPSIGQKDSIQAHANFVGSETHCVGFMFPPSINKEGFFLPCSCQSAASFISFPFLNQYSFLTHSITLHFPDSGQKAMISKAMREVIIM